MLGNASNVAFYGFCVEGVILQNQYLSSSEMRSVGGALDFRAPFKVTLLNDIGRVLRAREARASRAFYLVNSISPRTWGEVSFWSGRAFLRFLPPVRAFNLAGHSIRFSCMKFPPE